MFTDGVFDCFNVDEWRKRIKGYPSSYTYNLHTISDVIERDRKLWNIITENPSHAVMYLTNYCLLEGDIGVCGIAVTANFSCGISVILI